MQKYLYFQRKKISPDFSQRITNWSLSTGFQTGAAISESLYIKKCSAFLKHMLTQPAKFIHKRFFECDIF